MNDNIDTDQILPKQFLKLIDKKGFGKYLMYAWRYLDDLYTEDPDELYNGMLLIVQPLEVRQQLASLKPADPLTVDLEEQKILSPVGEFRFEIDQDWKHKLLNGLDDIGITLQYEALIAAYEKNRPAYWQ